MHFKKSLGFKLDFTLKGIATALESVGVRLSSEELSRLGREQRPLYLSNRVHRAGET
jgi:hypothetical protein